MRLMITMNAKSANERKKAERDRKKALGLVRKEIYIKPEDWEKVQRFIRENCQQ